MPSPADNSFERALADLVRAWARRVYGPCKQVSHLQVFFVNEAVPYTLPVGGMEAPPPQEVFVPNEVQAGVLAALEGKALTTDALAAKVPCDRRQLFRKPGGLEELKGQGLIRNHPRLGYYRPDAPPPELTEE